MHPFVIAALILLAVTPVAFFLGCVAAGAQSGQGPREAAVSILNGRRRMRFRQRHPDQVRAFGEVGYWDYSDIARLRRQGWTAETIEAAFDEAARWRDKTYTLRGAQPITRDAMWVLPADVVMAFIDADCDLWMASLKNAQRWVEAVGVVAPLAIRAGLGLDEARALAAQDRLTPESLATLVALQTPAA